MRSTLVVAFCLASLVAAAGCGGGESPTPPSRPQAQTPSLPRFNKVPPPPPGIIPVSYETELPPAPPAEGTGSERRGYSILPPAPSILDSTVRPKTSITSGITSDSLPPAPPTFPLRTIRAEDLPPPPMPK